MRHDCNEAVPDRLMADANRNDKLHPHCEAGRLNTEETSPCLRTV